MSLFNTLYIIGGLALFIIGWIVVIHTLIGLFPIIAGAFFFMLGLSSEARGIK
jgi:hypothetical protein